MSKIIKGVQPGPRRTVIYGGPGVGKSTWAASAPTPIFVPTEDGVRDIAVDKYPVANTLDEFEENLKDLAQNNLGDYKTLVIDGLDWLESLVHRKLCEEDGVDSIEKYGKGYGRGYAAAAERFAGLLRKLSWFTGKGLHVVCICHDKVVKVVDTENPEYDRLTIRLHDKAGAKVIEWADEVFAFRSKIVVEEGERGARAKGGKIREIRCNNTPAVLAKNRLSMPDAIPQVMPKGWDEYAKFITV
jgi:hypothetical protein